MTQEESQNGGNNAPSLQPNEKSKKGGFLKELLRVFLWTIVIVIPFRLYIAQPFVVNGASMDPTFKNGQYLIVDQISYRFETPERGSVIIFKFPKDPSKFFIKRVIGLPNEMVEIKNGQVTIRNSEQPEGFVLDEPYIKFEKKDDFSTTLDNDSYFVMGDNRLGSSGSRVWGPVSTDLIVGRPLLRLFPLSTLSVFPGYGK